MQNNKAVIMHITLVTIQPIPKGFAASNRILLYAKGLTELGNNVKIYIIQPTEFGTVQNNCRKGNIYGIDFEYTSQTSIISRIHFKKGSLIKQFYKLKREILTCWGICVSVFKIFASHQKPEVIFLYLEDNPIILLIYKLLSKIIRSKIVTDKSELPYINIKKSKLYLKWYLKIIFPLFDGVIVISEYLEKYLSPWVNPGKLLNIPVLIDSDEFKVTGNKIENNIVYCGILNEEKDGIISIIQIFLLIKDEFPELKLIIIGDSSNTENKLKINRLISENAIGNRVELTGYIDRKSMIDYLMKSKLMLFIKPDNLQTKTCFPSKLGEYLASGRPVFTYNIGVIPDYLKDFQNAFVSPSGNIELMANKIRTVFNDYQLLNAVGTEGRKTATEQFDYRRRSREINEFLHTI